MELLKLSYILRPREELHNVGLAPSPIEIQHCYTRYCRDYPHRQWVKATTSYYKRAVKRRIHHRLLGTRCPVRHHPAM